MQQVARDTLKQTRLLQLCIVVNNIKQLRLLILKLPVQLDWAQLEQRTGAVIDQRQIQHTLHSQLDSTVSCLDHEVQDVVKALATKVTPRHCSPLAPAWTGAGRCHPRGPGARGAPAVDAAWAWVWGGWCGRQSPSASAHLSSAAGKGHRQTHPGALVC